ncbi:MAG: 2-oxo acid dehydrogenase subunit E2 [Candidatus Hydrogenedentota bacterium]
MHEIKMPQLGQSVEEASIVEWFKKEGDNVEQGEPLFSVQTDKAEVEYEAPASGTLRKVLLEPDVLVPVMTVVALIGDENEALPDLSQYEPAEAGGAEPPAEPADQEPPPRPAAEATGPVQQTAASTAREESVERVSPRARRKAEELGIEPSGLTGSGPMGRVLEEDVTAAAKFAAKASPTARRLAQAEGVDLAEVRGSGAEGKIVKEDVEQAIAAKAEAPASGEPFEGGVRRVPLSPMRRVIAERMAQSKTEAPHYYITIEVDMAESNKMRESLATFRPSFNDFVLRACVRALQKHPQVNARWAGDAIDEMEDINIGFAVALPDGLIVPVIKQAQTKSLQEINKESRELTQKARDGKLTREDYTGNTFTVSNLGAFGADHFTAIINQPDSAILAAGLVKDRPVVIDGGIHVRPIMKLTLSSDHRVIDGALAAQFMGKLKEILENADY